MGTRSTISFIEKDKSGESTVAYVYQQYDAKIMVNGIPDYEHDYANGITDLAAQYICDFKDGIGDLYLYSPNWGTAELCDYNYKVIHNFDINGNADDVLTIEVSNWDNKEPFFVGKPSELLEYIKKGGDE